ncbi:hypothetical protein ACJX0J_039239 [Zea mays]
MHNYISLCLQSAEKRICELVIIFVCVNLNSHLKIGFGFKLFSKKSKSSKITSDCGIVLSFFLLPVATSIPILSARDSKNELYYLIVFDVCLVEFFFIFHPFDWLLEEKFFHHGSTGITDGDKVKQLIFILMQQQYNKVKLYHHIN